MWFVEDCNGRVWENDCAAGSECGCFWGKERAQVTALVGHHNMTDMQITVWKHKVYKLI